MNQRDPLPATATVPGALGRLRVALEGAYVRASAEIGLSAQQAELLCASLRPSGVGAIARQLRCDRSNVTRLVDRVAKRGLIHRRANEEDGRATMIELSPKGRRLAERFIASLEAQTEDLIARWPAKRQQKTIEALNDISDALEGGG
jgi:DNA-binding MarR family transcriptional regulator